MLHSIFALLLLATTATNTTPISISDALKKKLITVEMTGINYKNDTVYVSSFYGPCVVMKIKNISSTAISLYEKPGQFLMPEDTEQQRMMAAEAIAVNLAPNEATTKKVNAFCTESSDHAPTAETNFSFGGTASGTLLDLCMLISAKKYFGYIAQSAVWNVCNHEDPNYINDDEDTAQANTLRRLVCKSEGVAYQKNVAQSYSVPQPMPLLRYIDGTVEYTLQRTHNITLKVYNQDEQLVKELVSNVPQEAGDYKYVYHLTVPLNDPSHPHQWITVRYWLDGKLLHEQKHVLVD